MAQPMKTLDLHYPMIQFLITKVILFFSFVTASKYPQVTDSSPMPENAVSSKLRPISLCIYHPHTLPQK